ncbi:uncharacterized protein METZ01_LOCUS387434, partial [marine metagenome]
DQGATGGPFYTINFEEWNFVSIGDAGGDKIWELYNFRTDLVTIDSINISGSNSSSFTTDFISQMEIPPFKKGEIQIHFDNTDIGNMSGVMTVYSPQINNNEGADIILSGLAEDGDKLCGSYSGLLVKKDYRITCDIEVLYNTQLDIEAGTKFLFDGDYQFISHGTVKAIGTESDNIIFDNHPDVSSKWDGIVLNNATEQTIFDYVRISNSYANSGGLYLDNSSPLILHSLIDNNRGYLSDGGAGGVFLKGCNGAVFTDVTFSNNRGPYGGAIRALSAVNITFTNVNIINNES